MVRWAPLCQWHFSIFSFKAALLHQMQYYPTIQYYLWFLQITQQTDKYMLLYTFNAGNFYWVDNHEYLHFPLISISTFLQLRRQCLFCVSAWLCVFLHLVCLIFFSFFFLCGFFGFGLFYVLTLFSARLLCNVLLTWIYFCIELLIGLWG